MVEPSNTLQEARWVLRAQLGDTQALDLLLQSVQGPLLEFLRHRLGSQDGAEDCAQSTLMQVCKKLPSLREARAFRPWVYRIAAHIAARRFRAAEREVSLELGAYIEPATEQPEEHVLEDLLPQLREKMKQLPPNSSGVVFLHYIEGLSLSEISEVLDKPLGTIKSRLAYGLEKLRTQLQEKRDGH